MTIPDPDSRIKRRRLEQIVEWTEKSRVTTEKCTTVESCRDSTHDMNGMEPIHLDKDKRDNDLPNENSDPREWQDQSRDKDMLKHLFSSQASCQNWDTVEQQLNFDSARSQPVLPSFKTEWHDILQPDNSLRLWWYDMCVSPDRYQVYVFGKVYNKKTKAYTSCTAIIKNIQRDVYFLPRRTHLHDQDIPVRVPDDIIAELGELLPHYRVHKWSHSVVRRKYSFEMQDIPDEADYVKVSYDYQQPPLIKGLTGSTFSHVFGVNTSSIEQFILKQDIMGPGWLEIKNASLGYADNTWSDIEVSVDDPSFVNPLAAETDLQDTIYHRAAPLTILSLKLQTIMNHETSFHEIIAATACVFSNVQIDDPISIAELTCSRFAVARPWVKSGAEEEVTLETIRQAVKFEYPCHWERKEFALLNYLLAKIHRCDPDVIVGHNFASSDLDIILRRMKHLKIQGWHKLGRLKLTRWPYLPSGPGSIGEPITHERTVLCGRLLCDTHVASKDLVTATSYQLTSLVKEQLGIIREEMVMDPTKAHLLDTEWTTRMLSFGMRDAYLSAALMFKLQILPLTRQLTNLAGNLWSRSMNGARADRNEFLLLHEFYRRQYICPDKKSRVQETPVMENEATVDMGDQEGSLPERTEEAGLKTYRGGLVLDPKIGFYSKYVLLLDFNSLYPSIIQEYNVCFTALRHPSQAEALLTGDAPSKDMARSHHESSGVLPRLVKMFVDRRREIKRRMKHPGLSSAEQKQLDIHQMALKLTANSMYGCLGSAHSRFHASHLAMLITAKGRDILQNTFDLATQQLGLNIIYGDTDSIMIYTEEKDMDRVRGIGEQLMQLVNARYNVVEIDIDGFFKRMLLLRKKKYAALAVTMVDGEPVESVHVKGIDLVRRDWCGLSRDISRRVLDIILYHDLSSDMVMDIHRLLQEARHQVEQNQIPLTSFIIYKQLTKHPSEYKQRGQPHVQVALRLLQRGETVRAGDTIPYVISQAVPGKSSLSERAYHPDDIHREKVNLDLTWYLACQVHPPVARICAPIMDVDDMQLGHDLGIHESKKSEQEPEPVPAPELELEPTMIPLKDPDSDSESIGETEQPTVRVRAYYMEIHCTHCDTSMEIDTLLKRHLTCLSCHHDQSVASLYISTSRMIRSWIKDYYDGWVICRDSMCGYRTRDISLTSELCPAPGCTGTLAMEYPSQTMYAQLNHLSSLFQNNRRYKCQKVSHDNIFLAATLPLLSLVDRYRQRCAYRFINVHTLLNNEPI